MLIPQRLGWLVWKGLLEGWKMKLRIESFKALTFKGSAALLQFMGYGDQAISDYDEMLHHFKFSCHGSRCPCSGSCGEEV